MLVVDDHSVVRRGLLDFLGSEPDLEVVSDADGGTQALDLLVRLDSEGRRPDVVVMDLQMAPLDGIEVTRRIRARYDDIEVVALTMRNAYTRPSKPALRDICSRTRTPRRSPQPSGQPAAASSSSTPPSLGA